LRKVELPMAKSTIVVGINQTTLAALSMVIIAGFINSPGLGLPVLEALTQQQTGNAFVAGLCIVILAIMLDRTTTAASVHGERLARGSTERSRRMRRIVLAVTGVAALVCVYFSRLYSALAEFPESSIGPEFAARVQSFADWFTSTFDAWTTWVKDAVSAALLNPLQSLIAESPWYVTAIALVLLALVLAGRGPALIAAICLAGMYLTDLWHDAMITLTMTLVGALIVMVFALVIGVAMARRPRLDLVVRPVLDAAQVMPAFVYLIPTLLLFGPTRFTAIVAGVIYAAPIAIKLVADGITRVSATTVEAAKASGSTSWQVISKVQLPMARGNVVLAANQGLLYVLSMVVIGGLVGAGALGYDSVLGFSQSEYFGKGIAAAICIVLLGVMLDRVARGAVDRQQRVTDPIASLAATK
jgi:glycine betaine/proline transport system permease protein